MAILSDVHAHAQRLSEALGEERQFELVGVHALDSGRPLARLNSADVIVVDGLNVEDLPLDGPPIVWISEASFRELPPGVRACLPPDVTALELQAAVIAAAQDMTVLTQDQSRRWLHPARDFTDRDRTPTIESLTPRELQVLRIMAEGLGNKEIAGRLGVSDHTAKFHVAQILAKLGASTRAEAVAIGMRRGLVPI